MQIGSIYLYDFEVPPTVTFGGQHRLAVHKSANGTRVIDTLGPDDSDIQFRGIFSGQFAAARARALNDMRLDGAPIWLTWSTFRYRVIIKSLRLDFHNQSWIPYGASCLIVDQPGVSLVTPVTVQEQIAADIGQATNASAIVGIDLSSLVALLSTSIGAPAGSSAQIAIKKQAAICLDALNTIGSGSTSLTLPSSSYNFAGAFLQTVSSAAVISNAVVAAGYIGRISKSI